MHDIFFGLSSGDIDWYEKVYWHKTLFNLIFSIQVNVLGNTEKLGQICATETLVVQLY